ncbi:MAG TPA: efflux RND transporter periplasmic adaptor subunit [bacterium]|nr:efflux RND transporter periplasmic adaptor subunit [bacterium]HPN43825.1 efflux RND transporter periplasmic adaptor subunit [bacterium]
MNKLFYLLGSLVVVPVMFTGCNKINETSTQEPVPVVVQQAVSAQAHHYSAYSGAIEESETIPLSFAAVGTVAQVLVSEGDMVKKGQLLARLDTTSAKSAWEMAFAVQQQAEDAYKRLTPMYKNGNLPEIKYVEVETGLQRAKAAAVIARKSLDDCNLYASTDAIVGKRSINPGMIAMPNISSITLVKISRVFAKVAVPEDEISSVKAGDQALVTIGALGNKEFTGSVEEIGVIADPLAHTYKIKIGIANNNLEIKPGMICKVSLDNKRINRGLQVPTHAVLVDESGNNFVYTVDAATAKAARRAVQTGDLLNSGIEITAGLETNDLVVISGQHKLVDNAPVRIINN